MDIKATDEYINLESDYDNLRDQYIANGTLLAGLAGANFGWAAAIGSALLFYWLFSRSIKKKFDT